jgi:hypothetical protein
MTDDLEGLPTLEDASQEDLDLALAAVGSFAMYGGFIRAALAGIYTERAAQSCQFCQEHWSHPNHTPAPGITAHPFEPKRDEKPTDH